MEKSIISKMAEAELRKIVALKGGNEKGDLFENLQYLTEEVEYFGEKNYYIPLSVKKLLCRVIDPEYRIEYSVKKSANYCEVIAQFFWSGSSAPSGEGFVGRYLQQISPKDACTEQERFSRMEATCRGLAASRAITDATGIGLQLFGEEMELTQKEEAADQEERLKMQTASKLPTLPSPNERKGKSSEKKAKEAAPVAPAVITEEAPVLEAEALAAEEEAYSPAPEASAPEGEILKATEEVAYDLTEYYSVKVGDSLPGLSELTLGELYENIKFRRKLCWLANNSSNEEVRQAAHKIASSDEELKSYLK